MEVNILNSSMYGGFEGTFEEICENKKSLGEFLISRFDEIGHKEILVSVYLNLVAFKIYLLTTPP